MNRQIGLKDLTIAPITKNDATTYTAGPPIKLMRAISAKVDEKFNTEKSYSDDALEGVARTFDSVSIELEGDKLPPTVKAILFGNTNTFGQTLGNTQDIGQDFALGYRAKDTNGKYLFKWFYVCSVESGESGDNETLTDKPKAQSGKIKIVGRGREKDQNYKMEVDEAYLLETNVSAKAAINTWFTAVPEPLTAL